MPAPRDRPRLGANPHRRSARGTTPSSTTSASGTSPEGECIGSSSSCEYAMKVVDCRALSKKGKLGHAVAEKRVLNMSSESSSAQTNPFYI
uniref:Uncharacterized protein n=1 Tax=Oryza meridionalis TaxID=40149 RepID=A0A0E0EWL1_9ORYZ